MDSTLYKIVSKQEWEAVASTGVYEGSAVDHADGFIHLSSKGQTVETAAKHFAGQADLLLISVDADALGDTLKWEESRGGALFPHIYGNLPQSAVTNVQPLPLHADGTHAFPEEF